MVELYLFYVATMSRTKVIHKIKKIHTRLIKHLNKKQSHIDLITLFFYI